MVSVPEHGTGRQDEPRQRTREWISCFHIRLLLALGILFNLGIIAYTIGPLMRSLMKL
ncbi:MAG: hypothetical protein AB7O43_17560 [Hyphomicrobiaceae bacterium]